MVLYKLKLCFLIIVFFFLSPAVYSQVVINEIMWDELQYVELYNNTSQAVNLTGWTISNDNGVIAVFPSLEILPYNYFLIEEEEGCTFIPADWIQPLTLNQLGDCVTLKDNHSQIIDTANQPGMYWFAGQDTPVF